MLIIIATRAMQVQFLNKIFKNNCSLKLSWIQAKMIVVYSWNLKLNWAEVGTIELK